MYNSIDFYIQMTLLKGLFNILWEILIENGQRTDFLNIWRKSLRSEINFVLLICFLIRILHEKNNFYLWPFQYNSFLTMVNSVKICPIFDNTQSKCLLKRYQKILWIHSFRCKKLFSVTCLIVKFHICHHTNVHMLKATLQDQN